MKRRVRKIANFFAFNLLFFALYLNFIHKDKMAVASETANAQQRTTAFSGTVQAETPESMLEKKTISVSNVAAGQVASPADENSPLKLSIN